jgi:hypothetical protein
MYMHMHVDFHRNGLFYFRQCCSITVQWNEWGTEKITSGLVRWGWFCLGALA